MAKLPYMQFYAADFMVDVQTFDMNITGAWITLLCFIWLKSKNGTVRVTTEQLANLWKTDEVSAEDDLASMVASNLFDHVFDSASDVHTITSRRISRDRKRLEMKASWMSRQRVDATKTKSGIDVDVKNQISESDTDTKDSSSNGRLTDFDIFWKDYPRKVGKGAARKAWERALKKAREGEIISGLRRSKKSFDWYKDGGQFIPHPTTWLNQERWLDELPGPLPPQANSVQPKVDMEVLRQKEWERLHPPIESQPDFEVPF